MELTVDEFTFVNITIELEFSLASLLTVDKITCVLNLIILPLLGTLSMVHIIEPLAVVHGSVLINEHSISASFALLPLAVVDVSVLVRNSSFAMEQTFQGHPLLLRSVRELDQSETLPSRFVLVCFPLSLILSSLADVDKEGIPIVALAATLRT